MKPEIANETPMCVYTKDDDQYVGDYLGHDEAVICVWVTEDQQRMFIPWSKVDEVIFG